MGSLTHWGETSYVTFQYWPTGNLRRKYGGERSLDLFDALHPALRVNATVQSY